MLIFITMLVIKKANDQYLELVLTKLKAILNCDKLKHLFH